MNRRRPSKPLRPLRWLLPALLLLALLSALTVTHYRRGASPRTELVPAYPAPAEFQSAMAELNGRFIAELDQVLSAHPTARLDLSGPEGGPVLVTNWRDIAAVYLVRAAAQGREAGLDAVLLDAVFRDMVRPVYTEEAELHPHTEWYPSAGGTLREVEVNAEESVMRARVSCRTAEEMAEAYGFGKEERRILSGLARTDPVAWNSLFQREAVPTAEQEAELAPYLNGEPSPLRRELVRAAYSLLGRVGYFWGGKPSAAGWEEGWGLPTVVTAAGNHTSGTAQPYGLDCSGFVSWAAITAAGSFDAYSAIGDGVRDQYSRCTGVPWAEARCGDLAFFPDQSHIGVVLGFGADGGLRVVHCSYSKGTVVLTQDAAAAGFTEIGAPGFYAAYEE